MQILYKKFLYNVKEQHGGQVKSALPFDLILLSKEPLDLDMKIFVTRQFKNMLINITMFRLISVTEVLF
jgi:hypothetical protein